MPPSAATMSGVYVPRSTLSFCHAANSVRTRSHRAAFSLPADACGPADDDAAELALGRGLALGSGLGLAGEDYAADAGAARHSSVTLVTSHMNRIGAFSRLGAGPPFGSD